jgi:hypothetical protein
MSELRYPNESKAYREARDALAKDVCRHRQGPGGPNQLVGS